MFGLVQRVGAAGLVVGLVIGSAGGSLAQNGDVIQSQETNVGGVVAEITQMKRKEGVVTVRLRLRNTGESPVELRMTHNSDSYDEYYLTAGDKKYFILRDSEGAPLAPADAYFNSYAKMEKGGTSTWWAKYPAPPAEVTSVTFYTPISAPFEDVPVSE